MQAQIQQENAAMHARIQQESAAIRAQLNVLLNEARQGERGYSNTVGFVAVQKGGTSTALIAPSK